MSDLAGKRSILKPFLRSKNYNTCSYDSLRPNKHYGTKKSCKMFLSYFYPFDHCEMAIYESRISFIFLTKLKKLGHEKLCVLFHSICSNWDLDTFSTYVLWNILKIGFSEKSYYTNFNEVDKKKARNDVKCA